MKIMGLYITYPLTILIEIGLPLALCLWIIRRYKTTWRLVGIGAIIYLTSQVVHIPLLDGINWLYTNNYLQLPSGLQLILLNAVVGGLAAGLCEESARLLGFKILKANVQNESGALTLGSGHAGIECLVVAGLPMLTTFLSMLAYKNIDLSTTTIDQTTLAQIASLWNAAWYVPLASAVERLISMMIQFALTFIVLQVFIRHSYIYFGAAILYHAIIDGAILAISSLPVSGLTILGSELVAGVLSGVILWYLLKQGRASESSANPAVEPAG